MVLISSIMLMSHMAYAAIDDHQYHNDTISNIKRQIEILDTKMAQQQDIIYAHWKYYGQLLSRRFMENTHHIGDNILIEYLQYDAEKKLHYFIEVKQQYVAKKLDLQEQLQALLPVSTPPHEEQAQQYVPNLEKKKSLFNAPYKDEYNLLRPFPQFSKNLRIPTIGKAQVTTIPSINRQGLVLAISPKFVNNEAFIYSPYDGVIIFAAPYLQQGNVIIIEHRGHYYSTIIGLDQLHVQQGQPVLSGELIGLLFQKESDDNMLYVQLQQGTRYLNPSHWYASALDNTQ